MRTHSGRVAESSDASLHPSMESVDCTRVPPRPGAAGSVTELCDCGALRCGWALGEGHSLPPLSLLLGIRGQSPPTRPGWLGEFRGALVEAHSWWGWQELIKGAAVVAGAAVSPQMAECWWRMWCRQARILSSSMCTLSGSTAQLASGRTCTAGTQALVVLTRSVA